MTELVVPIPIPGHLARLRNYAGPPAPAGAEPRSWWHIRNAAGDQGSDSAELFIYDDIGAGGWYGGGVSPDSFATALKQVTAKQLTVRLNSPGGDVFDGITIANLIRSHPADVTVAVDGLAASIASVIAMAGDRIVMGPQAQMMIHDAMGSVWGGNPADMRDMADLLDRQSDNIAAAYRAKAGGMAKSWRTRMTAETWYSADEAVAAGLADSVGTVPTSATASPSTANPAEAGYDDWWDRATKTFDLAGRYRFAGRAQAPAPDGAATRHQQHDAIGQRGPEPLVINVSPDLTLTVAIHDAGEPAAPVDQPPPADDDQAADDETPPDAPVDAQETPVDAQDSPADAEKTAPDWAAATAHLISAPDTWAAATAHLTGG